MHAAYDSDDERRLTISVAVPIAETTAERLIEILAPEVRALNIGPDSEAEMGSLAHQTASPGGCNYIGAGAAHWAELAVDGRDEWFRAPHDAHEYLSKTRICNGTGLFTVDGEAARELAHQIRGVIGVNVQMPVPIAFHSFAAERPESMFAR
ncbi:acyl-CoA reductase-like NAD-dependent aldehyde dehydrogenase [Bradyrhizobium sp. GM6.1]